MFNIIVGTNREGSLSLVAAQDISAIYTDLGIENQLLLLSDLPPETFSPQAYADKPESVVEMTHEVLKSSGLVVVTPEYNGSMPGALKLFIDLLPFPESFEGRPVSFVGFSGFPCILRRGSWIRGLVMFMLGQKIAHVSFTAVL